MKKNTRDLKCKCTKVTIGKVKPRRFFFFSFPELQLVVGIGSQGKRVAPDEISSVREPSMDSSSSMTVTQREQLMVEQRVFQIYRLFAEMPHSSQSFMSAVLSCRLLSTAFDFFIRPSAAVPFLPVMYWLFPAFMIRAGWSFSATATLST